jgi:hypothetical protein
VQIAAADVDKHGSKNNITRELLELVDTRNYLVSTNGDKFKHPDVAAIEAVIAGSRRRPTLWFNYLSEFNRDWKERSREAGAGFDVRFPRSGSGGIVVDL